MAKRNIEHDLLRIFKRKSPEEISYTIFKIANGQYKFEIAYLSEIPLNELLIHLEKIIVLGTHQNTILDKLEDGFRAILDFANNIQNIKFRDIDRKNLLSLQYSLMLLKEKSKKKIKINKLGTRLSCLFFSGIIFFALYTNLNRSQASNDLENDDGISIESIDNTIRPTIEETLVLNSNLIKSENINSQKDETIIKTDEDKILEMYDLTEEEFNIICAIAMTEAKTNSYEDAYAVINTMYNRTISKTWIDWISDYHGKDVGRSLYYQAITPGQFVVYENGRYTMNLGVREGDSYQAVIDFLLTKELKHDYLSFKSSNTELHDYEQFVVGGNKYHNILLEEDRFIEDEISRN